MANLNTFLLTGGKVGFDKRIWRVVGTDEIDKIVPTVSSSAGAAAAEEGGAAGSSTELNLALTSGDGEEGFPGRVEVRVSYRLGDGEMVVVMAAHAVDRDTPRGLICTGTGIWAAIPVETVHGHVVRVNASHYTPINANHIPTGEILPVADTPFDFLSRDFPIGARMADVAGGYDHNYVLHCTHSWSGEHLPAGGEAGTEGSEGALAGGATNEDEAVVAGRNCFWLPECGTRRQASS
ncbi:unnamed protein product [Closterium sp. Naga37s-1]|nr:unnamed protein product [Closterium sp. Naga37s-1]